MLRRIYSTIILTFAALLALCPAAGAGEPDLSSPKAAEKSLYNAVEAQDAAGMREILYAPTPAGRQLADAFIDLILSGRRLADAAHARFGADGDHIGQMMMNPEALANIDAGEVKVDGPDAATLTAAGQSRGIKFHRADGKWQLVITDFAHATAKEIPGQIALLASMTKIMNQTANEIAAGKFPNAHDAEAAIVSKCNDVMIEEARQANAAADQRMRELEQQRETREKQEREDQGGASSMPAPTPATSATPAATQPAAESAPPTSAPTPAPAK